METLAEIEDGYIADWLYNQSAGSCSCHINPPCEHCVNGYSLTIDEFVDLKMEKHLPKASVVVPPDSIKAYDRAMEILL